MGSADPLILSVAASDYGKVSIEASDGYRYSADLLPLAHVYCFPKNAVDWGKVSIDSYGLGLIWENRFEVHVDQIVGLATTVEVLKKAAHAR